MLLNVQIKIWAVWSSVETEQIIDVRQKFALSQTHIIQKQYESSHPEIRVICLLTGWLNKKLVFAPEPRGLFPSNTIKNYRIYAGQNLINYIITNNDKTQIFFRKVMVKFWVRQVVQLWTQSQNKINWFIASKHNNMYCFVLFWRNKTVHFILRTESPTGSFLLKYLNIKLFDPLLGLSLGGLLVVFDITGPNWLQCINLNYV
jgi:hypothetical protein